MINQSLVILAGGKGSRISKFTKIIPKPLIKINNKPFLEYLINFYSKANFRKIYILTGYKGYFFKKYHNKKNSLSIIKCIREREKLDTGGAILQLKNKIKENFLLINGDSYLEYNVFDFIKKKISNNSIGKMCLIKNLNYKSNNKLSNIKIIKNKLSSGGNLMNAGIYEFKPTIFKFIKKKQSLENDVLKKLIKLKRIDGFETRPDFIDIGTYKNLEKSKKFFLKKNSTAAAFLDRDGVINYDFKYVHKLKDLKFKKGAIEAIKYLNKKKIKTFIVTNQAGIAKNIFTENTFIEFQKKYFDILNKKGGYVDEIIYCPFHPFAKIKKYKKKTGYRKPGNLMIKKLEKKWNIDLSKSFMIGDQKKDYLSAKKSNLYFEYATSDLCKQVKKIVSKKINNYS